MKKNKHNITFKLNELIAVLAAISLSFAGHCQIPYLGWANGHTVGKSWGLGICTDSLDNVYTTGTFDYTVEVNTLTGTNSITATGTGNNCFIQKTDKSGNIIWLRGITGTGEIVGNAVVSDDSGNIYVVGAYSGMADFDPSAVVFNESTNAVSEIFVLKLDSNGELIWVKTMEGSAAIWGSQAKDVKIGNNGNLLITGDYYGTVDFDPGTDTVYSGSGGIFIQNLDSDGNLDWIKTINATSADAIACDQQDNIYVVGTIIGTADFDPGIGVYSYTSVSSSAYRDTYLVKLDQSGTFEWATFVSCGVDYLFAEDVEVDMAGNVYSLGRFNETVDFDPGPGVTTIASAGSQDIFLQKLDSLGNLIWVKTFGLTYYEYGKALVLDSLANIFICGKFQGGVDTQGVIDLDPNSGEDLYYSSGMSDIFLSKLDSSGNYIWGMATGGILTDQPEAICLTSDSEVLITGFFDNKADFDPTSGVYELENPSYRSMFVSNYKEGFLNLNNPIAENGLYVYPNPLIDYQNIDFIIDEHIGGIIQLVDINGKLIKEIYRGQFNQGLNNFSVNFNGLNPGFYVYVITFDNGESRYFRTLKN